MYYIVYLTTNLVNDKYYVGVHSTYNLDDGYLGSGLNIQRAVKKYGKENFNRKIIYYCYDETQMFEFESLIVNTHFISRKDTYNITLGGNGSWHFASKSNIGRKHSLESNIKRSIKLTGLKRTELQKQKISTSQKLLWNDEKRAYYSFLAKNRSSEYRKKLSDGNKGKKQSEEQISKRVAKNKGQKRSKKQIETMSKANKGIGKGKIYSLTDPQNNIYSTSCLKSLCDSKNLPYRIMIRNINKGTIIRITNKKNKNENWENCLGWSVNQL